MQARRLVSTVLVAIMCAIATTGAQKAPIESDQDVLIELERGWNEAFYRKDVEFIRNLLVCKDERAAGLLEVVESFRDRYIETAKKVSPALLISALNILNDAEINYKAARNKRLHVELALIKLCYLQQAIELSADPNSYRDGLSKKKIIEAFIKCLIFSKKSTS